MNLMVDPLSARLPRHVVTATEGAGVDLPKGLDLPRLRDRLLRVASGYPFDIFTYSRGRLRCGNVVGVIEAGDVQIQILPKVSSISDPEENAGFLIDLLSMTGLLPRAITRTARIPNVGGGFVEPIIRSIADEISTLLQHETPRRYSVREELSTRLRGRIDLQKLAVRPPAAGCHLPIRHAPLQTDNPLSRIVKATAEELLNLTRSSATRHILRGIKGLLSDVEDISLTTHIVEGVVLTPFEAVWHGVYEIALALAQGKAPDPATGGRDVAFGLLFPLYDLFEAVVRRVLSQGLPGTGATLARRQNVLLFESLSDPNMGSHVFDLRPDYLIADETNPRLIRLVADAKWKRLKPSSPTLGISSADIYQISTYITRLGVEKGLLILPLDDWMASPGYTWVHRFGYLASDKEMILVAVNVPALVSRDMSIRTAARLELAELVAGLC